MPVASRPGRPASSHAPGAMSSWSGAVAVNTWWLTEEIAAENCIAAYQPIAAANIAASYVNLAHPGTHDCTNGTAPAWNSTAGWIFNGTTNSRYLKTGVIPVNNQTWSMIVRFTGAADVNTALAGYWADAWADPMFILLPRDGGDRVYYGNGKRSLVAPRLTSGVMCVAGTKGFRNGVDEGITIASGVGTFGEIYIGCVKLGSVAGYFSTINIQAMAIFDVDISASAAALTIAIAAL